MTLACRFDAEFIAMADLVGDHARAAPHHVAVVDGERQLNYRDLDAIMDRVAAALVGHGVGPRDTVAICAAASLEYVAVFLGALRIGVAVAPLMPSATPQSLAAMAVDCGAKLLFVDATTRDAVAAVAVPRVALDGAPDDGAPGDGVPGDGVPGEVPFAAWLAPAGTRPAPVAVGPDFIFNIIYSSGTTGTPKGIAQPHMMRWQHIKRLGRDAFGPGSRTLVSTPLYSNTTLVCLFPTLASGGTVILMRKFDARGFLVLAEKHRATHAMLVPVQYRRIMALEDFDAFDLTSFVLKLCTSAPFPAALKRDVLARWPGSLVEYYGLTEGGGTCILHAHKFPDKLDTVGRPAEGSDVRLIDERGVEITTPGAAGEIVGRSTAMMTGYHNQPGKTREAEWFDAEGRRYMRTGDIGRFDADGFLTLLDRRKDLVISGGFNVYPSDLEAVLAAHEAVLEAAVVGVPSPAWGETPVGFVALRDGAAASPDTVREWANVRLGRTQRLSAVHIVDALPRSAIGKVLKRELRDRLIDPEIRRRYDSQGEQTGPSAPEG